METDNKKTPPLSKEQIRQICLNVEQALGQPVRTPGDFDRLSYMIYARTGEQLSRNTLRRVWGTLDDGTNPRTSTLLALIHFLGYRNIESFLYASDKIKGSMQSGFVMNRKIAVTTDMQIGNQLRLTWLPDRVCDIEYEGSLCFRVVASEKTRLQPGDTFLCSLIIDGEPLYLDQLQHHDNDGNSSIPMSYICGLDQGIKFERIN